MLLERTAARSILSFGLRSPKFQVLCNAHRYFASAQKFPDHIPFQGISGSRFFPCPVASPLFVIPPHCQRHGILLARNTDPIDACPGVARVAWSPDGGPHVELYFLALCVVTAPRPTATAGAAAESRLSRPRLPAQRPRARAHPQPSSRAPARGAWAWPSVALYERSVEREDYNDI